jgi:RND superfamily putative drug exporter
MMSQSLYRLGRLSVRRPWVVIGSWLVLAVVVVGTSGALGRPLKDSLQVPGLDSQQATELMATAGAGDAGLTAQVVATPLAKDATFFGSAGARSALAHLQAGAAALPHVLSVHPGVVSADGRVALIRLQYPPVDQLSAADLSNLKAFGADAAAGSPLRIEMGGDLYQAFEQSQPGLGEVMGLLVAALIVFLAFGSVIATAVPIGTAVLGLAIGVSSMSLVANVIDIPSWAPVLGAMVGLGVGIDYALFIVTGTVTTSLAVCRSRTRWPRRSRRLASLWWSRRHRRRGILGLVVAGVPFMTAGGIAISVVVLVMVGASVTLLPALARPGGAPHQPPVAPSRSRQRRRSGPPGLVEMDRARDRNPWPYAVGSPCSCSPWPRRSSRCVRASPTTARCRGAGPSARPTTW